MISQTDSRLLQKILSSIALSHPIFVSMKQGGNILMHDTFDKAAKTAIIAFQRRNELGADNIYKVK